MGTYFTPIEDMFTSVEAMFTFVEAIFTFVETIFSFVEAIFTFVETMFAPIETIFSPIKGMITPQKWHVYAPASLGERKCDVVTCDFVTLSTFVLFVAHVRPLMQASCCSLNATLRCFHSADDGRGGKIVSIIC